MSIPLEKLMNLEREQLQLRRGKILLEKHNGYSKAIVEFEQNRSKSIADI